MSNRKSARDPEQVLLGLIQQATLEQAAERLRLTFIDGMLTAMRNDKVGLEKAISRTRDFAHAFTEMEPIDVGNGETPVVRSKLIDMMDEVMAVAERDMRGTIERARELIALADQEG